MAWTVNDNFDNASADGVSAALINGYLKIYNSSAALLANCQINSRSVTTTVLTLGFSSATVANAATTQTADNFTLTDNAGNIFLSSNSIDTTAGGTGDLEFNDITWDNGDTVTPGTMTIDLAALTAS